MEEQAAAVQLPKYRCHKEVWAAKIVGIERGPAQWRLNLDVRGKGETGANEIVGMAWYDKHQPEVGGYFVQYVDGYKSYSPAKALEDGYTRIDETGRRLVAGDIGFAGDALEYAWGVIANAFGGNWTKATEEWQQAAARFRDEFWHPWLDMHGHATRGDVPTGSAAPQAQATALDASTAALRSAQDRVDVLWRLLDDIDTLDDACKGDDASFRKHCYAIQQKRHAILDGDAVADPAREFTAVRTSEQNRCVRILLDAGITDEALLDRIRSGEEA